MPHPNQGYFYCGDPWCDGHLYSTDRCEPDTTLDPAPTEPPC